jgi:hypothetical protein
VTAFNTLEYIPRDKLDAVLAEISRVAAMRVMITVKLADADVRPVPQTPNARHHSSAHTNSAKGDI